MHRSRHFHNERHARANLLPSGKHGRLPGALRGRGRGRASEWHRQLLGAVYGADQVPGGRLYLERSKEQLKARVEERCKDLESSIDGETEIPQSRK